MFPAKVLLSRNKLTCISIGRWVSCQHCVGERQELLVVNHFAVHFLGLWVGIPFFTHFYLAWVYLGFLQLGVSNSFINFLEIDVEQVSS